MNYFGDVVPSTNNTFFPRFPFYGSEEPVPLQAINMNQQKQGSFIHPVTALQCTLQDGKLTEKSLPCFLEVAFRGRETDFPDFQSALCLNAINMQTDKGFNTRQLFAVTSTCSGKSHAYVVKEPVRGLEEATRLNELVQSPYLASIVWPHERPGLPTISATVATLSYTDQNGALHYLLVMPMAPGKALCDIVQDYRLGANICIPCVYYQIGLELANFHNQWPEHIGQQGGSLLGSSVIHGDLKCVNIFFDPSTNHSTLIDNETMAEYLERPGERITDIAKVLFGHLRNYDDYRLMHMLDGITDLGKWYNDSVKSFIVGYVSAYPQSLQAQAFNELQALLEKFLNGSDADYNLAALANVKNNYIMPFLTNLSNQYNAKQQ
ncbi:MAG: hypothetical protein RLZ12_262 [Bacillota bacterium]|jgi:serine/threonine protein kinase